MRRAVWVTQRGHLFSHKTEERPHEDRDDHVLAFCGRMVHGQVEVFDDAFGAKPLMRCAICDFDGPPGAQFKRDRSSMGRGERKPRKATEQQRMEVG